MQTVRGCPKHCSFCVWRTDGQKPRQRGVETVVAEIVELRRGFGFIALADENFYPVTLADIAMAERKNNGPRLSQLRGLRAERFELMDRLAQLAHRAELAVAQFVMSCQPLGLPHRQAVARPLPLPWGHRETLECVTGAVFDACGA